MIRFKDYLTELFDGSGAIPYKIKGERETNGGTYITKYEFGEYTLEVHAYPNGTYEVEFEHGRWGMGLLKQNKDHFKVYSTVVKILNEYFTKNKLKKGNKVLCIAVDARTIPLYTKFLKIIQKQTGGKINHTTGHTGEDNIIELVI
jgi:hypothetical protein